MNKYEMMHDAELEFELSQKRIPAYETKSILLDYHETIKRCARGKPALEPAYKKFISLFYLKEYSQYRHMWE